jgi:hypothetical protein
LSWNFLDEGPNIVDSGIPGIAAPAALIGIAEGLPGLELSVETAGHSSVPPMGRHRHRQPRAAGRSRAFLRA